MRDSENVPFCPHAHVRILSACGARGGGRAKIEKGDEREREIILNAPRRERVELRKGEQTLTRRNHLRGISPDALYAASAAALPGAASSADVPLASRAR